MTENNDLAIDAIETIYRLWRVDPDHARWVGDPSAGTLLHQGYGFDWWPGDFKVAVRVNGPHPGMDRPAYRLSVRTDFLCDVDVSTPKFRKFLSDLNQQAPTFAICGHPTTFSRIFERYESLNDLGQDFKSSNVWLSSTAYLYEETKEWLPPLFAGLAVLQPIESQFAVDAAANRLGGGADCSRPSGRASPTSLDNILNVAKWEIAPRGQHQSAWIGTGEFEEIVDNWGRCDSGFGKAFDGGLAIEMPFGDTSAIVVLKTDMPHRRLGNGLLVFLKIPYLSGLEDAHALSIELNYLEDRIWSKLGAPLVGNWSAEEWRIEDEPGFGPLFASFIPNHFYQRGLAEIFVIDAMSRARWCRELLLPDMVDLPMDEILDKRLNR